jgi:DNA mismatch repair protein MutS
MEIDAPTLRGLEVLDSPSGRQGSLLSVLDRTVTPAGARLLVQQLSAPLTKPDVIRRRLAMVGFLVGAPAARGSCREGLSAMPDIQRACGRLSIGKGGPRDLAAIRDGLGCAASVARQLQDAPSPPAGLAIAARELTLASEGQCGQLAASLRRALIPAPPTSMNETEYIADGYAQRLDAIRRRAAEVRVAIQDLQQRYVEKTAIKALKIRANSVLGYHVEVPASSAAALGEGFTLRQGLASTSRFGTIELDQLAAALASATEQAAQAEQAIFTELRSAILIVSLDVV